MNQTPVVLLYAAAFAWCAALLAARVVVSDTLHYAFLAWNLFLACIPLGISFGLAATRRPILALPLLAAWLLFFPNAPYVLTDLLHTRPRHDVPQWFDLLLVLSFALVALFLGFHSLRNVQDWISARIHWIAGWLAAGVSCFLSGFGIYLGRFLRWNSWDIVGNPMGLAANIADRFLDPSAHPRTWAVTAGFGTFLFLVYCLSLSLIRHAKRPGPLECAGLTALSLRGDLVPRRRLPMVPPPAPGRRPPKRCQATALQDSSSP